MSVCTFFGHRECYDLDADLLRSEIENMIGDGVDTFYVGNQGRFDAIAYRCLRELRAAYPHIHVSVVLAYLPDVSSPLWDMTDTIYPEIEGHPKFAIERRNRWMIGQSDRCLCYVNRTWGGAYKFAKLAKHRGLTVINLGTAML